MDDLLQQLKTRFLEDNRKIKSIVSLVSQVVIQVPDTEMSHLCQQLWFWDKDLPASDALQVRISLTLFSPFD